jgi:hypothetical protein
VLHDVGDEVVVKVSAVDCDTDDTSDQDTSEDDTNQTQAEAVIHRINQWENLYRH